MFYISRPQEEPMGEGFTNIRHTTKSNLTNESQQCNELSFDGPRISVCLKGKAPITEITAKIRHLKCLRVSQ